MKQLHSPMPPSVLPLIAASVATLKTVVSNPVLHVTSIAHDLLRAIADMRQPPTPGDVLSRVKDNGVEPDNVIFFPVKRPLRGFFVCLLL